MICKYTRYAEVKYSSKKNVVDLWLNVLDINAKKRKWEVGRNFFRQNLRKTYEENAKKIGAEISYD